MKQFTKLVGLLVQLSEIVNMFIPKMKQILRSVFIFFLVNKFSVLINFISPLGLPALIIY